MGQKKETPAPSPVLARVVGGTTQGRRRIADGTLVRVTKQSFDEAQLSTTPHLVEVTKEEAASADVLDLLPPGYGEEPAAAPPPAPASDGK